MRKSLVWRNAVGVMVVALGAGAVLGGSWYWNVQQRKVAELQQQIEQLPDGKDKVALVKDRIALENAITGSLLQGIGGLLLFVTAYVSLENLKATQRNVLVVEEKQVTERFTQAINQLGSDKIEVRLGGIYALERIARDSEKDHWTIMEVLTSFIQEKSPLPESEQLEEKPLIKIARDVQAALTVIGRRDTRRDPEFDYFKLIETSLFDLSKTSLVGANLVGANFHGTDFSGSNFHGARLTNANLSGANLSEATLSDVELDAINLSYARLGSADLSNKVITEADWSKFHQRAAKWITLR
jgi:hypothetical protein